MKYHILAAITIVLFSNCNSTSKVDSKKDEITNQSEVEGTYYVNSLNNKDVSEHKLTIIFNAVNKTVTGFSGCNTYYTSYTVEEKSISFSLPGASKIYCEKTMKLEEEFLKALSESKTKEQKSNSLILSNEQGEVIIARKGEK